MKFLAFVYKVMVVRAGIRAKLKRSFLCVQIKTRGVCVFVRNRKCRCDIRRCKLLFLVRKLLLIAILCVEYDVNVLFDKSLK